VAYKQFWARYFYKAGKVEHEEERKKKVPSSSLSFSSLTLSDTKVYEP
jgi:hypothetical protein